MRKIHIIGGGTVAHIRPHLALAAPAYGATVKRLFHEITVSEFYDDYLVHLYTTKMAGNRHQVWTALTGIDDDEPKNLETNGDIAVLLDDICVMDPDPSIVFLPAALCDFEVDHIYGLTDGKRPAVHDTNGYMVGKGFVRLSSESDSLRLELRPAEKIIQRVRRQRKDVFLVGFKTTTGAEKQDQFNAGLELLKKSSCNLVLANDLVTKLNMVITPEQAPHHVSTDRRHVLRQLVGMALARSKGHFTRSEVHDGPIVPWQSDQIPTSLRTVVNHCIARGAYKPFMGKTVGHFALRAKADSPTFITSRRGVDFNKLDEVGMVVVQAFGDNKVVAQGAKPSVGGQSQRIIFAEHPEMDCIVHFHCPLRVGVTRFPTRPQGPYECGSHECGQNTSSGLEAFVSDAHGLKLKAVMLDKHGPNIVFNSRIDPATVIEFIERHWDLDRATSEVP